MPAKLLSPPVASSIAQLTEILDQQGVAAGLGFLNSRVTHRGTAIYRLEAQTVRNLFLFDRDGLLLPEALGVMQLGDSFCQHAMRDGGLRMEDSGEDVRVDGSPLKGVVVAYHGLPLLDRKGELFGSLCHFDFVPRPLPDDEFHFLKKAARLLPAYLKGS